MSIEADVFVLLGTHTLDDNCAFLTSVLHDLAQRLFQSTLDDGDADLLVRIAFAYFVGEEFLQRLRRTHERHAATRHDAFFDCGTCRVHRVFDARLLLLHLRLGCRADFDDCHTADEFRQTLLQLLAVVVRRGLFDLRAQCLHTAFDVGVFAVAFDEGRVVLVNRHLLGAAQIFELDVLQLDAEVFRDDLAARQDGDVFEHRFTTITEARSFDGSDVERAA